jgi:hypothetical protein
MVLPTHAPDRFLLIVFNLELVSPMGPLVGFFFSNFNFPSAGRGSAAVMECLAAPALAAVAEMIQEQRHHADSLHHKYTCQR